MLSLQIFLKALIMAPEVRAELERRMLLGTERAADIAVGKLRKHSLKGELTGRTGNLARAWSAAPGKTGAGYAEVRVRNPLAHARIQNQGGEVAPKNAQHLAIPLEAALTPKGVPRYVSARAAYQGEGLFAWRNPKTSKLFLAKATGKRLELWYFLTPNPVELPATGYADAALDEARPLGEKALRKALISRRA